MGKRVFRAVEIAESAFQNRRSAHRIASGLVMKGDGNLNQGLKVEPQEPVLL
jgi:hypothetical protein